MYRISGRSQRSRFLILAGLIVVALAAPACHRLNPPQPAPEVEHGPLAVASLPFEDAIPNDYGKLVGITSHPKNPEWAALWFQREDETISVVWVNVVKGRIHDEVVSIPRR